ncbi:HlyD family secretion protein [Tindallia magadiensis]|uniref:HlyD family secretion protein n=1 Tax=Tindallia magadiensis TaxID=69895 RepID=A0A1I3CXP7_9FIRM|nr:HlyD family efflux transporter periplasmic adaptor subunit [Tindallia magadiensis]SFH79340.1 HlyD family secretion protein [Tindallia magadiensis]
MKQKKKILILLMIILTFGMAFFLLMPASEENELLEIQPQTFRQVLTATGRLTGSPFYLQAQVTGQVLDLTVAEGDLVEKEQLLVQLDDEDLQWQLRQQAAAVAVAQAQHRNIAENRLPEARNRLESLLLEQSVRQEELALEEEDLQRRLHRHRRLYEQGALPLETLEATEKAMDLWEQSVQELEKLELQIATARKDVEVYSPGGSETTESLALLEQAEVQMENLQQERNRYQLSSPIPGKVLETHREVGELAQKGDPLLTLVRETSFIAEVEIDERNIALLEVGQPALLWPEAYPSREVSARVSRIAPRVDADTGTVLVQLEMEEKADFLIEDLTLQAEIEVRVLEDALLLPVAYLAGRDPVRVIVLENGQQEERILPRTESIGLEKILVLEGLEAGESLVKP